jgi:hypothetical protein
LSRNEPQIARATKRRFEIWPGQIGFLANGESPKKGARMRISLITSEISLIRDSIAC